jgi:hypothetical protein
MKEILVRNEEFRLLILAIRLQKHHAAPHVMRSALPHEVIILPRFIARRVLCLLPAVLIKLCNTPLFHLLLRLGVIELYFLGAHICQVINLLHLLIITLDLVQIVIPDRGRVIQQVLHRLFIALFRIVVLESALLHLLWRL